MVMNKAIFFMNFIFNENLKILKNKLLTLSGLWVKSFQQTQE